MKLGGEQPEGQEGRGRLQNEDEHDDAEDGADVVEQEAAAHNQADGAEEERREDVLREFG
eukprot:232543-Heterocapsa_arctica.AAC.1